MRVILTHYFTDDTCTFLCRFVARVTEFVHSKEDTAVNRFKTVAHIRQRTAYNHTHRVIDIRGLHFLVNLHRDNVIILNNLVFFHLNKYNVLLIDSFFVPHILR